MPDLRGDGRLRRQCAQRAGWTGVAIRDNAGGCCRRGALHKLRARRDDGLGHPSEGAPGGVVF